jgi:uncharacterized RDD family membrane protein YckC
VYASDRPATQPVWFFPSDYAGFGRRLTAELIDLVAVLLLGVVVTAILVVATPTEAQGDVVLFAGWTALVYAYFVVLKGSRFGTLGYRLTRVHIVDVRGRRPGLGALTVRLLFALAGPINFLLDVLWIPSDRYGQALRDKIAHTYVVRSHARPAGPALLVYRHYDLMGLSLLVQDIEPIDLGASATPRRATRSR